jgi:lysophospholipase L1-like esterase
VNTFSASLTWSRRLGVAACFFGLAIARGQQAPAAPASDLPASASVPAATAPVVPVVAAPTATTAAATPAASGLPTIFVCGDSTSNSPMPIQGWGTPIANYFDPAKVVISNVGHAGTSSRSYYNGDWLPKVLPRIKAGDYVLIVFGINDNGGVLTGAGAARGSLNGIGDETQDVNGTPVHTYGWYMEKMANDAREKGAHPYFLTVTARDIWTNPKATFKDAVIVTQEDGYTTKEDKIERGTFDGKYTQWTKDAGEKIHVPVLDLTNLAADKYEKMGREVVMKLYSDHNHTFPAGADVVASTIVSGLKAFPNSPFTVLLSDKGKAVEVADVKYVAVNAPDAKPADAQPVVK